MKSLKAVFLSVVSVILFSAFVYADDSKSLFKIERNKNANIVQYDLNFTDNVIDEKNPVDAYWLLWAKADGRREELSAFDKKAYGYKVIKKDAYYELVLKAVEDRPIKVFLIDGNPKAEIQINGKSAYLTMVYVFAKDGFMGIPKVSYYTLNGIDIETGKEVTEQIDVK